MLAIEDYGIKSPGRGYGAPIEHAQVLTARAYLKTLPRATAAPARWPSSYTLKHQAERWGAAHGMSDYVTNGALILAAQELDIPLHYTPRLGPNVRVGGSVPPPSPGVRKPRADFEKEMNEMFLGDEFDQLREVIEGCL